MNTCLVCDKEITRPKGVYCSKECAKVGKLTIYKVGKPRSKAKYFEEDFDNGASRGIEDIGINVDPEILAQAECYVYTRLSTIHNPLYSPWYRNSTFTMYHHLEHFDLHTGMPQPLKF